MLLQADGVAKGLSADTAAKRSHPAVGPPNVDLQSMRGREHLVTGDAVVGVGGGGVVSATVHGLLWLWAVADVSSIQAAGSLQESGGEVHLAEIVGCSVPGVRGFVVGGELCHVGLRNVVWLSKCGGGSGRLWMNRDRTLQVPFMFDV